MGQRRAIPERIAAIRAADPDATFRSSFILGYPGETEDDQRELLAFIEAAQLDWAGFFTFSSEEGTLANGLDNQVRRNSRSSGCAKSVRSKTPSPLVVATRWWAPVKNC